MVYKRVCRTCPICGSKYLVRLANHLADVHQLDVAERKKYLQEAKLQPKRKFVVYQDRSQNNKSRIKFTDQNDDEKDEKSFQPQSCSPRWLGLSV